MADIEAVSTALLVGILVCDHVDPKFYDVTGGRDYGEIYTEMLTLADPTLTTRIYDAINGELPASPNDCNAWIITGSRHDAHGDEQWVLDLLGFIRQLAAAQARTVGVCFGHQAVAQALGGRVEPAGIWKVGPQQLEVEPTAWFEGGSVHVNAMHRDIVTTLPPGATRVGTGTTAEQPMFLIGSTVLCLQDHPEFTPAYTQALIDDRASRIGTDVVAKATEAIANHAVDNDRVGTWLAAFLADRRR